ncbi:hypothetical protein [Bradyrhizobium sp. 141]|uniref:hypothetical protein n=1 Tax=Bradyrhizobium sp. 141 TaxID=2782617 RepID=UPI001FFA6A81|nr:hypothetical protein [Bradyrhizobium sp. 141]MCK1718262.1 hypothetical protein [Bradyrhizobium sp. 141]
MKIMRINKAETGDVIEVSSPRGNFILQSAEWPVALLSAGIGATPVLAMLSALAEARSQRSIVWLHAARDRQHHPFATEVRRLVARLGIFKDEDERRDADMGKRFGSIVDATLTREAVVTTDDSRWSVIEAVARDLTKGVEKLARNADADFTPDTYVNRFPPPTALQVSTQTGKSLTGLADAWQHRWPEGFVPVMRSGGRMSFAASRSG